MQKRSMKINGHRTSVALEQEFWAALERAASLRGESMPKLMAHIDETKAEKQALASACRLFALSFVGQRSAA